MPQTIAPSRGRVKKNPPDAAISEDSGKHMNSMIPDLVTFTKNISSDETPLGGADHFVDVKTLGTGQAYHSNSLT